MNKNLLKKVLCFTIALLMLMPSIPNLVSAAVQSALIPGTVALTKEANWVDYDNRIAEVKFTVKGEPVKTAVDVVLVIDRSGSMGFGSGSKYSPCTNPAHYDSHGNHKNNIGWDYYDVNRGCTNRMIDAKNASIVLVETLLDNNVADEFGNKNRVALVPFNSSVSTSNSNKFTDAKSTIETKINNLNANDGTNYTDALDKARQYIKDRNIADGNVGSVNSRPTFIVMLSDGRPEPSSKDGKDIADNLKTYTGEPLTIFSLGLNMLGNDANVLKYIATNGGANGYYKDVTNTGTDLQPILEQIASLMKPAGKNATLEDVISQYFDYYEDGTLFPNKTISHLGKDITWEIGTITKEEIVLTFYVKLKEEYNISGTYPTNASASLTYTPVGNNPGSKTADTPNLSVIVGSITVKYILVDQETGRYIASDGNLTDDINFAVSVGGAVLPNLDLGTHTITPVAPTGYMLLGNADSLDITLTEGQKDKIVNFEVFEIKEPTYNYTINYFIKETVEKVPGISPNPKTGKDEAGKIIIIPHPVVPGYKVMGDQPTSLTITNQGTTETVFYEIDVEQVLNYTVDYYKDGVLFKTEIGDVPTSNPVVESVLSHMPEGYTTGYGSTPLPFTVTENDNVIKVYYMSELGSTISYVVNYYKDGNELPFATIPGDVSTENPVVSSVSHENMPEGYHFEEEYSTPFPFTVNVESENIINVYYVKNIEETENSIIINHYTKIGSASEVLDKSETKPNPVTTGSSIINGADYKDAGIIAQGFAYQSSSPESIEVFADITTETAIVTYTFNLHYYKSGGSTGGGGGGNPPVIIKEPEVPLAELEKFDHFAYVIGYPEGDIRALNNITREEVAMIFYRLLTDESRNSFLSIENTFTDIESSRWSNRAISTLFNAGILSGYPDGTFKPTDPISRAEFATIATKFDKLELNSTSKFTDITGHWAAQYITSAEIKGWVSGYPDMTFKPEQDIKRAEAMTLINNVLERKVPEENIHPDAMFWPDITAADWYYEAVMEATNSHDYMFEEDGDELWTGMKINKVWP